MGAPSSTPGGRGTPNGRIPTVQIDQPTYPEPRSMTPDAEPRAPGADASAADRAPGAGASAAVDGESSTSALHARYAYARERSPRVRPSLGRQRSLLAAAWVIVAALGVGGGALSLALFNHAVPLAEPFAAGTIVLDVTPTGTLVTLGSMVPGDQVDGVLTVLNDGTDDLRYAMTSATTDDDARHLADVLRLDVERRTGCAGAVLEVLYSGPIANASFGDPSPGNQAGDRSLSSGSAESICYRVTLPADTDIVYANATTTASLTFWAEQTAGNP